MKKSGDLNVSENRAKGYRDRATDHALVSLLYLPVRPTANLTIGNESKKITSVAFVPDGVYTARCATSRGHAIALEAKAQSNMVASRLLRGSFVQLFLRDENVKNFAIEKLMRKFFTFHVFSLGQRKLRVFAADRLSRVGLREFGRSSCESAHVRANSCMLGLPRRLAREPFAAVAVVVIHSPGQFVERSSLRTGGRVRECRCVIT